MLIAFSIGGTISYVLFSRETKQQFVNPEQFRTPQLSANQTLQPSFDPGVIAGKKPLPFSPDASAAKELEASLGRAVAAGPSKNTADGTKPRTKPKDTQQSGNSGSTTSQQAAPQQKPRQSLSDIRDELM